jgi:hypothetical protein
VLRPIIRLWLCKQKSSQVVRENQDQAYQEYFYFPVLHGWIPVALGESTIDPKDSHHGGSFHLVNEIALPIVVSWSISSARRYFLLVTTPTTSSPTFG